MGGLSPSALGAVVADAAAREGLLRVAAIPVEPPRRFELYRRWLDAGHHGEMTYLATPEHLAGRADLGALLRGARTVIACALPHDPGPATTPDGAVRGAIARYARGDDYHRVLRDKLTAVAEAVAAVAGRPVAARPCVDSAPVLERELAERAGVGFVGKHTLVIVPGVGSWVLLGELLLDVEVALDGAAPQAPRCGTCRACLDACPTGAFVEPFVLDARRCVSYLTIESAAAIPAALRRGVGGWVFGCDACQEACPYNHGGGHPGPDARLAARDLEHAAPDLLRLAGAPSNQLRRFVARTALRRLDRARLLRNVCVALGNVGDARAVPALAARLADASPLVRRHAAWALGELGARDPAATPAARAALAAAADDDPEVAAELRDARARLDGNPPG